MIKRSLLMRMIKLKYILLWILTYSYMSAQNDYVRLQVKLDNDYGIFINQYFLGESKLLDTNLKSGIYEIKLVRISDFSLLKKKINFDRDSKIEIKSLRSILISTSPVNAHVYVDSIFYGYTPLKILFNSSDQKIEIQKNGFKPVSLNTSEINQDFLNISMEPEYSLKKPNSSFYKFLTLGSMILSGIISVQFKNKANKLYEESKINPDLMKKVRKYDTISAIFSISLQINFGIFTYLILTE